MCNPPVSGKVHVAPDPDVTPGFDFDFESEPMNLDQLRHMIFEEVASFHGQGGQEDDDEEEKGDEEGVDEEEGLGSNAAGAAGAAAAAAYHYPATATALTPPHPNHHLHQPNYQPNYGNYHQGQQQHQGHYPHHMMSDNIGMDDGSGSYVHDTDRRERAAGHNYNDDDHNGHGGDDTMQTSSTGASAAEAPRYGHVLR